jgi:BON domain-containing protein
MRRGSFDFGSDEGRERRYESRNRGEQAGRGEETWYREGNWELPADQDIEWRGMRSGGLFDQGPFAGRGPRGYRRSDQAIFEEVCERLTAHGYIDATEIDVDVKQGIVTLTGIAPDRRQKRLAEQTIENIAGVQDVSNQVRLAGRGEERMVSDAKEERAVADAKGAADMKAPADTKVATDMKVAADTKATADMKAAAETKDERHAGAEGTERKAEQRTEAQLASERTTDAASQLAQSQPAQSQPTTEQKSLTEQSGKERQPVGVMDETRREQQSETTAPRSAAALDRSDAAQPDRGESMSGDRGSAMASSLREEMATERRPDNLPSERRLDETATQRRTDVRSEEARDTASERVGGTSSDSTGQRELGATSEATAGKPATHEVRINAGSPVYGREGDKIGEVAEGTGDYFVVHKGLIFATELYIPAASIIRSDENGVQVDISKEELANYRERPTTVPT